MENTKSDLLGLDLLRRLRAAKKNINASSFRLSVAKSRSVSCPRTGPFFFLVRFAQSCRVAENASSSDDHFVHTAGPGHDCGHILSSAGSSRTIL